MTWRGVIIGLVLQCRCILQGGVQEYASFFVDLPLVGVQHLFCGFHTGSWIHSNLEDPQKRGVLGDMTGCTDR